ncbi:aminoacyltransferase [Staphylococcus pasteuri]|nr:MULTISPECIES: aminoacyltransferase [Staphylococcus]RQX28759.1 aminoacyltransferase [Staphylococcus warneri]MCO0860445.1 aminoacyltransferase [Staphylococcus pasteuri]MEB6611707.1 aminoacyltransferase [Staphylococcus pasteuri]OFV13394.1 methicillin resistance protein [Staphylococcus sp. HMSC13A10]QDW84756.1 aminoacyltransferase [Staphylococcus pasteuri]
MKFTILTREEFDEFAQSHFKHYTQSLKLYDYRQKNNNDSHIVGVKDDNNKVLAACVLTEARILRYYKYFYTHRGPILDYDNLSLLNYFFENLKVYTWKHKGVYVLVDPYIIENIRNPDGKIIKHYNNEQIMNALRNLGYLHQGYSIGYSNMSQIRWMSVLNIDDKSEQQLLKDMNYQTRRNVLKTIEIGVKVRTLSINEISKFYRLFQMAEKKHGFKFREEEYFKQMLDIYKEDAMIKLAYIDLIEYLDILQEKILTIEKQIENSKSILIKYPNSKKNKTLLSQLESQKISVEKKIFRTRKLIKRDGKILDLAAALFICTKDEVYYLSSGSNPKYNEYMGAYRLQWEMIRYAKEHKINRYNFYGITGKFGLDAEDYGVQQFKKGFNTHIEELIGDFIIPVRPLLYKIYNLKQ